MKQVFLYEGTLFYGSLEEREAQYKKENPAAKFFIWLQDYYQVERQISEYKDEVYSGYELDYSMFGYKFEFSGFFQDQDRVPRWVSKEIWLKELILTAQWLGIIPRQDFMDFKRMWNDVSDPSKTDQKLDKTDLREVYQAMTADQVEFTIIFLGAQYAEHERQQHLG